MNKQATYKFIVMENTYKQEITLYFRQFENFEDGEILAHCNLFRELYESKQRNEIKTALSILWHLFFVHLYFM